MQRENKWRNFIIFCLELFFGINVVLLDLFVFSQSHNSSFPLMITSNIPAKKDAITPSPTFPPTPPMNVFPTTATVVTVQTKSSIKEAYIPLGSGQTNATDWTDISGALGYADSSAYVGVKKVVLEATVTIPNGNETAWIRLFNKTDGHPVWYSETSWQGGDTQFLISQPITLDTGNKIYQVQVKNQLPSTAIVGNARLHISLQ